LAKDDRRQRRKDGHENAGDRDDERRYRHHRPLVSRRVNQGAGRSLGDDHGEIDAEIGPDADADVG
jgi:hypothetical protein